MATTTAKIPAAALPDAPDEAALVALMGRVRTGDAEALGRLYDLALGRVYGLAMRVLRQPQDAEEVVSDVFLQVWDQAVSYSPQRGSVMSWLQTLAWSRSVDRLRRLRRQRLELPLHPEGDEDAYTSSEDQPADALLEQLGNAQSIRRAFDILTPAQRSVLELAYYEELSQPEIAERTGLALGTVKSHARRGLAALREALQDGTDHHDLSRTHPRRPAAGGPGRPGARTGTGPARLDGPARTHPGAGAAAAHAGHSRG